MGRLGRVGSYTLVERLGRGGMGDVYLATNRRGEGVALKMLHDVVAADSEARIRLEREVRALRRVESPYVARVVDADLACERPYLVMEHIEGDTLLERVRRDGPLQGTSLVVLAQGLATALSIIHAAGVVHRDLKPANVLVNAEDEPVLIDFGIAQVLDATRLTMTGTFLGTPSYAAPELFVDEPVGEPADVHAWAATVAFAATGRPTFGRGTAEAQMYAILNGQADLAGIPAALLPLIRAALHREAAKRPTAALLAARLARLARATSPGSAPPKAVRPVAERAVSGTPKAVRPVAERMASGTPKKPETRARAIRKTSRGRKGSGTETATGGRAGPLPAGNAALILLAVLAVPCVVATLLWPLATFAVTGVFAVLARTIWVGHWLVRKRTSARARGILRIVSFPLTFVVSLLTALAWPGLPAVGLAGGVLWLTLGASLPPEWWSHPTPVAVAGIVFGVVCGGIIGREVERISSEIPELRKEGLRALAVLGGFVALCAAAVRAIALLV
ncbi:serine/threonine-protein kinase [Streptosporangium sp. NPDC087985]|uniref:serine/threonine-protein kinase n=1 Tax=Streptosporangium sp. NPDC087985 TaxID=3366196 RepID=UPI0037FD423D